MKLKDLATNTGAIIWGAIIVLTVASYIFSVTTSSSATRTSDPNCDLIEHSIPHGGC